MNLEDPLYLTQTLEPDVVPYFTPCNMTAEPTPSDLKMWTESNCYIAANKTYKAPGFFDRLDGELYPSSTYQGQADSVASEYMTPELSVIGLEGIIDVDLFDEFNVTINVDKSWVDHLYWKDVLGECNVDVPDHPDFALDALNVMEKNHILKYNLSGLDLDCRVWVFNDSGTDKFVSPDIKVPIDTTIWWVNNDTVGKTHTIDYSPYGTSPSLRREENHSYQYITAGTATYTCALHTAPTGYIRVYDPADP